MKKTLRLPLLAFICLFSFVFIQCSDDDKVELPTLKIVEGNSMSLALGGETKTVTIEANNEWKAVVSDNAKDWLSVTPSEKVLSVTATANPGMDSRDGVITITSAGLTEELKVSQFGKNPEIIPEETEKIIEFSVEEFELIISSNVEYTVTVEEGKTWIRKVDKPDPKAADLTDKTFYFETDINYGNGPRSADILIKQVGGTVETKVSVEQKAYSSEDEEPLPIGDVKLKISEAWASSEQDDEDESSPIINAIDDSKSTIWHSNWKEPTVWPMYVVTKLKNADYVDYFKYTPRSNHTNGNWKEFKLFVSYEANPDKDNAAHWTQVGGTYDFEGAATASEVPFSPALENPTAFKFELLSGMGDNTNGFASAADLEFFKNREAEFDTKELFADDLCTTLKAGITEQQIADSKLPSFFKNLAFQLMAGDYSEYRIQEYEAYRPVNDLVKELKTSAYSQYENPTGIWLEKDKTAYVFVDDTKGEKISLKVKNWTTEIEETYTLKQGINAVKPNTDGQTYISYYTMNYKTAEPIKIHIANGLINGYFDRNKNTAADWSTLINNAAGDYFDIRGDFTNLAYHIGALKQHCPTDGMKLIEVYDEIIEMEFEQMGIFKYYGGGKGNNPIKNRMMGMNSSKDGVFMHAGGLGAVFHYNTMGDIGNPSKIVQGSASWGIAHEYGHVNQVRPGLRWIGTVECTNNIYSSYVQYMLTSKAGKLSLRLEHEACKDINVEDGGSGTNIIGGRFNSHMHYGVLKGDVWLRQWGQDWDPAKPIDERNDHFVKLVPMWQLNLYYKIAAKASWAKPDWYGDICEEVRKDNATYTDGEHQINFMKRACKYTQADLSEFFETAGMLKPAKILIEDYGWQTLEITQAMVDDVKAYAKQWSKPEGALNYLSGTTVGIYEAKAAVQGTKNQGVAASGKNMKVDHSVWKNVVAYETYAGSEVVRLVIAGTGTINNSSTLVPYPEGATKIVGISWDGKRTTVYEP